ncbi:hypothetical protein VTK73DRAFT_7161 [Phialemonium thermophilum]|uniref:NmrA-like domain-containing protein n=1 Tax=Phialemonium thermophilum TaxID=223376 RepID=A0ABR3XTK1_9PEZI
MPKKKIIVVFGATGAQGGSVARIFLTDPVLKDEWTVRAVTRDPTKETAKTLEAQGAQLVQADLNDKASLVRAMSGATEVFAVTNYWESLSIDVEIQQGKNLVDAAKEARVEHFIWSSLPNITKLSNGELSNVYHFDGKAQVEDYARESGIPATYFFAGSYMSNLPGSVLRLSPINNAWTMALPIPGTAPLPLFDVDDTGKFVKGIVRNREKLLGKRILGAESYVTCDQIVEEFKKAFPEAGKTALYYELVPETYLKIIKGLGFPDYAAQELLENMLLLHRFGYFGGEKLDESHSILEDKLTTWPEFIRKASAFEGLK